jgi:hypothetical protein
VLAVTVTQSSIGASVSTLKHRQTRQQRALHRWEGCRVFFHNHPRQARTRIGRAELRKARVWIGVLRRELGETRHSLIRKVNERISVPQIICAVFGSECSKALSVAACESRYSTGAANGQYFGLFQMGASERARFGGSSLDPWDQARAAYRYWQLAGWSPWECA